MYGSPVTRMMWQLSQPSSSISARVVGRTGAIPNRFAQYGRYENSARAVDMAARASSTLPRGSRGYSPPSQGSPAFFDFTGLGGAPAGTGGAGCAADSDA